MKAARLVDKLQGDAKLAGDIQHAFGRQRGHARCQQLGERLAFQKLHAEPEVTFGGIAAAVNGGDAGMAELRQSADFPQKPLAEEIIVAGLRASDFDRFDASHAGFLIVRFEDRAHATMTDPR